MIIKINKKRGLRRHGNTGHIFGRTHTPAGFFNFSAFFSSGILLFIFSGIIHGYPPTIPFRLFEVMVGIALKTLLQFLLDYTEMSSDLWQNGEVLWMFCFFLWKFLYTICCFHSKFRVLVSSQILVGKLFGGLCPPHMVFFQCSFFTPRQNNLQQTQCYKRQNLKLYFLPFLKK